MTKGLIWVLSTVAVDEGDELYAIVAAGATRGQFTSVVGANLRTYATCKKTIAAGGLTIVELNNPQFIV